MSADREGREERWVRTYRTILLLLIETAAGLLGLYIMFKAVNEPSRPWLYAAAIGMMGLPAAHTLQAAVNFASSLMEAFKQVTKTQDKRRSPQRRHDDDDGGGRLG